MLVMTDGRDECLARASATWHRIRGVDRVVVHDDTGDAAYRKALRAHYPAWQHIAEGPRRGFGGAIRYAWQHLAASDSTHVFHMEDDFEVTRDVDLSAMGAVLAANPHVAQMALRRQAWSPDEIAAGGVIEMAPEAYTDHTDPPWMEHTQFFTTNPCLYPIALTAEGWPEGDYSEGMFTIALRNAGRTFGYWGSRTDSPWVRHIGEYRVGRGY